MTRGKIIYIDRDGKVFSSVEFNGDMYPDGNADRILEMFEVGFFSHYNNYERFVIGQITCILSIIPTVNG